MADRRMIHRAVICSDEFIEMSYEAQALFFQLQIEADGYGLLSSVKKILRTIGVKESALQELIGAGFVLSFGNGVIALTHWNVANSRKNDRTEKTYFPLEKALLIEDENKVYHLPESNGIQTESIGFQRNPMPVQNSVAQNREKENRVAQSSVEEESARGGETPSPEEYVLSNIQSVDRKELSLMLESGKSALLTNAVYIAIANKTPWWKEVKRYMDEQQT